MRTTKSTNYKHPSVALLCLILLVGDVDQNPGPIALSCGFQRPPLITLGYSNSNIIATLGDGHCFLLAVQRSIAEYMKIHIPFGQLSNLIGNEFCNNGNIYLLYFNDKPEHHHYQLTRYFNMKIYNRNVADLLHVAAANALNIQISIITDHAHSFKDCPAFQSRIFVNSYIILHLHSEHYSVTT